MLSLFKNRHQQQQVGNQAIVVEADLDSHPQLAAVNSANKNTTTTATTATAQDDGQFDFGDDDSVMDAEDLHRLHGMDHVAYDGVDFDYSNEYQKPSMELALLHRRDHMPSKFDGTQYSIWNTKTGRFVNKRYCETDCFGEGRRSHLIPFGAGISAYFKMVKAMTVLFSILTIMSLPLIYVNFYGGEYFQHHAVSITSTTLGNLYAGTVAVDGANTTKLADSVALQRLFNSVCNEQSTCPFEYESLLFVYCLWDAIMVIILYVGINIIHRFTTNENAVYKRKIPKIEDYSIEMSVPLGADVQSIQQHFESENFHHRTKVFDVQLVERSGNSIAICVKRGLLLKRFARLDATSKSLAVAIATSADAAKLQVELDRTHKRLDATTRKITELDELAKRQVDKQEGKRALMAFVTFETQEAKIRVLEDYDDDKSSRCCTCRGQSKHLRFHGKHAVHLKPAPPPSTLLWENQEVDFRYLRILIAVLIFAALLLITAALSFITDQNRFVSSTISGMSSANSSAEGFCHGKYDNFTTVALQVAAARNHADLACYCDDADLNPLLLLETTNTTTNSSDLQQVEQVCGEYEAETYVEIGKQVGFSVIIVLMNILIYKIVMIVCVHLIKFRSIVHKEFSIMRVIFVITLINTAVIVLLVNVDWARLTGESTLQLVQAEDGTILVESGDFVDFEPEWYSKVGLEIFVLSLLNIVGPYLLPIVRYVYHLLEQRKEAKHAVSQQALNDLFLGEEFLLSVRLAQTLTMVFFTMAFSSGVPLLYWTALVAFFVAFWFDKFFFLRLARTPPQFDTMLQQWALRALEWSLVVHCLLGFWMYSSPRMFPASQGFNPFAGYEQFFQTQNTTGLIVSEETAQEVLYRFSRVGPVILLAVAIGIILMMLMRRFGKSFGSCMSYCCTTGLNEFSYACGCSSERHKVSRDVMAAERFNVLLAMNRVAGVPSYNILANPVYQTMFQLQQTVGSGGGGDLESSLPQEFHSLQDALNIRKATAVDSLQGRSVWKETVSVASGNRSVKSGNSGTTRHDGVASVQSDPQHQRAPQPEYNYTYKRKSLTDEDEEESDGANSRHSADVPHVEQDAQKHQQEATKTQEVAA